MSSLESILTHQRKKLLGVIKYKAGGCDLTLKIRRAKICLQEMSNIHANRKNELGEVLLASDVNNVAPVGCGNGQIIVAFQRVTSGPTHDFFLQSFICHCRINYDC